MIRIINHSGVADTQAEVEASGDPYDEGDRIFCIDTGLTLVYDGADWYESSFPPELPGMIGHADEFLKVKSDESGYEYAAAGGVAFIDLTDVPSSYASQANKYVRVNGSENALEFVTLAGGGDLLASNNLSDVASASASRINLGIDTTASQTDSTDKRFMSDAQETKLDSVESGATANTKASGAEVDAGTDDLKFLTPKAIEDSTYIKAAYADAKVADAITNGVTDIAPSQNAVFDALAGKEPIKGSDDNYVTDAQLVVIGNTSGTNTGDNATNTQYSGLAASKQDTLVSATNIKTVNGGTLLGSGDLTVSASATGVLMDKQFSLMQSDGTLNAALGVQTWAGTNKTGQDVFTVAANTTYLVEGYWYVNTGATTHTTAIAWALATATVTDFQYRVILWSAAANTLTTTQSTCHVSGVASKVLNATSTAVYTIIQFSGIIVIGTGGTITPQINFSANPTGTNLMKRGSWTSFTKLGDNTVTQAGGWA